MVVLYVVLSMMCNGVVAMEQQPRQYYSVCGGVSIAEPSVPNEIDKEMALRKEVCKKMKEAGFHKWYCLPLDPIKHKHPGEKKTKEDECAAFAQGYIRYNTLKCLGLLVCPWQLPCCCASSTCCFLKVFECIAQEGEKIAKHFKEDPFYIENELLFDEYIMDAAIQNQVIREFICPCFCCYACLCCCPNDHSEDNFVYTRDSSNK